ncbi:MAG TPA: hypothetical protein VMG41_02415 [Gemmatimonadales bacterium]|nr:hypothetical protein [Gemmatimonadales bacterium]
MRILLCILVRTGLISSALAAQAPSLPPDSLLEHMIGHWVLRGPMAGRNVVHDLDFQWVLGREYVEMHERSRELTATGAPAYEAIVYIMYDTTSRRYACLWLDNTASGPFSPIASAAPSSDSIPFLFRTSDTDTFHNTLVYHQKTDEWEWHMDNDSAGIRRPFARVTLTRQ